MAGDNTEELIINAPRIRKPSMKRRLAVLSDEEDETHKKRRASTSSKRPKAPTKRARTESSSELTPATPVTPELEVDVEGDVPMEVNVEAADGASAGHSPEPTTASQPTGLSRKPKTNKDAKSVSKRSAKKRQVVYTDSEDDGDQFALEQDAGNGEGSDEDSFTPPKKGKGKATEVPAAGRLPKGMSMRGAKRRTTKEDDKPILMKDESKSKVEVKEDRVSPVESTETGAKAESVTKVDASSEATADPTAPSEDVKQTLAAPVKRKLPPIKKNKPPAGSSSSSTSAQAPSKGPQPPTVPSKPPVPGGMVGQGSAAQRKPAATVGIADLDLFNANTYAELFNKGGSSTPRGGVNRGGINDRRKELHRMRDEARAKREAESKQSFDLQARAERVAIFEERLRQMRSRAYLPNFIAGGLWDRYDREERALAG